ncbi:cohesin domain-containing protein, partial [Paenibacillus sp. MCAF20]
SDSHLLTYPGERIDGGYHVLAIQVKDNNGNPAEKTYAFTMNAGERLFMKAAEEAVSNEIYAVNLNIKDYANAETAQFELNYDPNTLQVENVDAVNGVTQTSDIDNENGIVQVNLDGLSAAVADDIATVNF